MPSLSEQVRELEAERDRLRVQYDIAQRVVKHEESLRIAAESRLAYARVEGAREALTRLAEIGDRSGFKRGRNWLTVDVTNLANSAEMREFRDREYPAVPEGESRPTPTPEPLVISVQDRYGNGEWHDDLDTRIEITPADARRIVSLAAQDGGSV